MYSWEPPPRWRRTSRLGWGAYGESGRHYAPRIYLHLLTAAVNYHSLEHTNGTSSSMEQAGNGSGAAARFKMLNAALEKLSFTVWIFETHALL